MINTSENGGDGVVRHAVAALTWHEDACGHLEQHSWHEDVVAFLACAIRGASTHCFLCTRVYTVELTRIHANDINSSPQRAPH